MDLVSYVGWEGAVELHLAPVAGCCEHSNESSGSMKVREFLDYLTDY
jgi:hypothetical protein